MVLYCTAVNETSAPQIETLVSSLPEAGVPLIFQILTPWRELQNRWEDALEEIGLSPGKAGVLKTLAKAGKPVPLSELAQSNKCVRSNVTQLVDRLELDGLVRRMDDPEDRRVTLAMLTPEGKKAYTQALRVVEEQEQEILRVLGPKGAAALARALELLATEGRK
jgi:DNA-binding MarR family transcriptional regulator